MPDPVFRLCAFADEIAEPLDEQIDVLRRCGIQRIEMRGVNGRPLVSHTLPEVRDLRRALDAAGFEVPVLGSPIGKIGIRDDFAPHLALFRHTLEVAGVLSARMVRIFSFFLPSGEEPSRFRDEVMRRTEALVEAVRGTGLVLLHENEKDIYGDSAERCLDLLETFGGPSYRAAFDPANFIQCGVEPYPTAYRLLRPHIAHVHIKDARRSDAAVVPSGSGDGRIADLLEDLEASGYRGLLSIEPHLGGFTGLQDLEGRSGVVGLPPGGPREFVLAWRALLEAAGSRGIRIDG